ncbi:MAG: hypothetical protein AAF587_30125 [Bacteroidota bacterium]
MDDRYFDDVMKQRLEAYADTSAVDEAALIEVLDVADHLSPGVSSGGLWGIGGNWIMGMLPVLMVIGGLWWIIGLEDQAIAAEMMQEPSEILALHPPLPPAPEAVQAAVLTVDKIEVKAPVRTSGLAPIEGRQQIIPQPVSLPQPRRKLTVSQLAARPPLPAVMTDTFDRPQLPLVKLASLDGHDHFHIESVAEHGQYLVDFFGKRSSRHHRHTHKSILIRPCTASKSGCRR